MIYRYIHTYNAGRRKSRIVRGTKANRRVQLAVYKDIYDAIKPMVQDVENIGEFLEGEATPEQAVRVLRELREKWRLYFGGKANNFSGKWVGVVDREQRQSMQKRMAAALGVDFTHIFDDKIVRDAAEIMAVEASSYIKLIPERYFDDIQEKVLLNFQQIELPDEMSLREYIKHTYHLQDYQAKRLARDQTSKINTAITQARNRELGIEEYIWRTVGDARVVGTPGGLWTRPNRVHGNHYARNGKKFRWDNPPFDGHPGWGINCRCWADPVINIDKLKNIEYN